MDIKCPHCNKKVTVRVDVVSNKVTKKMFRFPKTWSKYPNETFDNVYLIDKDYIFECIDSDRVIGTVRTNLIDFITEVNSTKENV